MDLSYLLYMLPALILSFWAQSKVKGAFSKWSQIPNTHKVTGIEAAEHLKPRVGLQNVTLKRAQGILTDHYDPRDDTLALSQGVADASSIAAMAITAHELGHALQDKEGYGPMRLRSAIVPIVGLGSNLGIILLMIGIALQIAGLTWVGILLFSGTALFSLVTLPVEFDASKRARKMLDDNGLVVSEEERIGVDDVLSAAAWTYVAGLVTSLAQIFYYISIAGRASGNRRS